MLCQLPLYLPLPVESCGICADFQSLCLFSRSVKPPYGTPGYPMDKSANSMTGDVAAPPWQGRSIAGPKLRMVEFSAFLEQQREPDVSLNQLKLSL